MEAERFVGTAIVQLFPFVGIDMVHHPVDVVLCQVIKAASFRKDPPDQFVIDLNSSFLVRTAGITVKYPCAERQCCRIGRIPVLDLYRIREFTAVISFMPNSG